MCVIGVLFFTPELYLIADTYWYELDDGPNWCKKSLNLYHHHVSPPGAPPTSSSTVTRPRTGARLRVPEPQRLTQEKHSSPQRRGIHRIVLEHRLLLRVLERVLEDVDLCGNRPV